MAGNAPEVSVVTAVYNGERYLAEAIESILGQSFADWELVIVDDGSTDGSSRILAEYTAADPRVVVHRQENGGVAAASNRGLELARAPLVARLDADDLSMPGRLEQQHRFLRDHPQVGMVGGQGAIIDRDGREVAEVRYPLDDAAIREQLERTTGFVHSSVMIRKEVLDQVGGYRSEFDGAEDLDLWLRIAAHTQLAHLPERVVSYRIHPDQASNKIELQAVRILAARESARRREVGLEDSLSDFAPIDEAGLLSLGVSRRQVDEEVVESAVWLAKTADRAGYRDNARELFAVAWRRARAAENRPMLTAKVRRAEQKRAREQGHMIRARLLGLAAAVAERRGSN
ncbi:MAG TPA: glycosyltransferase [Solirubrobacterales bacterium]|nr:glycosyltransferase [Solirubrobacterales bacterium]